MHTTCTVCGVHDGVGHTRLLSVTLWWRTVCRQAVVLADSCCVVVPMMPGRPADGECSLGEHSAPCPGASLAGAGREGLRGDECPERGTSREGSVACLSTVHHYLNTSPLPPITLSLPMIVILVNNYQLHRQHAPGWSSSLLEVGTNMDGIGDHQTIPVSASLQP